MYDLNDNTIITAQWRIMTILQRFCVETYTVHILDSDFVTPLPAYNGHSSITATLSQVTYTLHELDSVSDSLSAPPKCLQY